MVKHTVRMGESLHSIGRRYGLNWRFIYLFNFNTINDPNLIFPGQVLKIPFRSEEE